MNQPTIDQNGDSYLHQSIIPNSQALVFASLPRDVLDDVGYKRIRHLLLVCLELLAVLR